MVKTGKITAETPKRKEQWIMCITIMLELNFEIEGFYLITVSW